MDSGGDVPQPWSVKKNRPLLSERIREDDSLLNHNRALARKSIIQYFVTALLVSPHSLPTACQISLFEVARYTLDGATGHLPDNQT